mgnify:CR=1 FL=1
MKEQNDIVNEFIKKEEELSKKEEEIKQLKKEAEKKHNLQYSFVQELYRQRAFEK